MDNAQDAQVNAATARLILEDVLTVIGGTILVKMEIASNVH
jgi:hypothetical protein